MLRSVKSVKSVVLHLLYDPFAHVILLEQISEVSEREKIRNRLQDALSLTSLISLIGNE